MTKGGSSVEEQNELLAQLLSLSTTTQPSTTPLLQVSDQVPAGRGLSFTRSIDKQVVLLTLGADTLINVKSFRSYFHQELLPLQASVTRGGTSRSDAGRMSSAFLLSLLLARAQLELESGSSRKSGAGTKHRALQLFVQTLPRRFDTVPLTWSSTAIRLHREGKSSWKRAFFTSLLRALPSHSEDLEKKVRHRFVADWSSFSDLLTSNRDLLTEPALLSSEPSLARDMVDAIDEPLFLWAWLCVNSRCVFLPLGLARHGDNFTLAPMLDMANHTSDPVKECKVRYLPDGGLRMHAPEPEAEGLVAKEGDECFITYGAHSNESLLSEYGFVLPRDQPSAQGGGSGWRGSRYVDVTVDQKVEELLKTQGKEGEEKIELLQNRGYWGEMTLHPFPEAHPSHRLVPVLRLAALDLHKDAWPTAKMAKVKGQAGVKAGKKAFQAGNHQSDLDKWEETLAGYRELISDENERSAHQLLIKLCESRRKESEGCRRHLDEAQVILDGHLGEELTGRSTRLEPNLEGCKLSMEFVRQLLDEEEAVLRLVSQAARDQVEW